MLTDEQQGKTAKDARRHIAIFAKFVMC